MPVPFVPAESASWYREQYLERGRGCREISNMLGVSRDKVRKDLRRAGIEIRPQLRWSTLKRDYFAKIDTPNKAYIYGLICADGTLDPKTQQLRLRLAVEALGLLELIRIEIGAPSVKVLPARPNCEPIASLCISSKKIVEDLIYLGVTKRKDYVLGPVVPVGRALVPHFVRGLVDGDGALRFVGRGKSPRVSFTNRNRHLLRIASECWRRAGAIVKEYRWAGRYSEIYCDAKGSVAVARVLYLKHPDGLALPRKRELALQFDARVDRRRKTYRNAARESRRA